MVVTGRIQGTSYKFFVRSTDGPVNFVRLPVKPQFDTLIQSREIDQRYLAMRNICLGLQMSEIQHHEIPTQDLITIFRRDELAQGILIAPEHKAGIQCGKDFISEADQSLMPNVAESIKANALACILLLNVRATGLFEEGINLTRTTRHTGLLNNSINYIGMLSIDDTPMLVQTLYALRDLKSRTDLELEDSTIKYIEYWHKELHGRLPDGVEIVY